MTDIHVPDWPHGALEVMRVGLGFTIIVAIVKMQFFRQRGPAGYPVGIARVVDLNWLTSNLAFRWMQFVVFLATLLYVADVLTVPMLLILSTVFILEITLQSSYGAVSHGHHLIAVVLVAQFAAFATWDIAQRFEWDLGSLTPGSRDTTAAWWAIQAVVAVYFTSGLVKLIATGGRWIAESTGLLLAARRRAETERLMGDHRARAIRRSEARTDLLGRRLGFAELVFSVGLLTELCAPLGLFGEGALVAVGVALVAFHAATSLLLTVRFPEYQLILVSFFIVPAFVP